MKLKSLKNLITITKEMKKLYHVANRFGSEVATERRAS
jgi:hypothetical protein